MFDDLVDPRPDGQGARRAAHAQEAPGLRGLRPAHQRLFSLATTSLSDGGSRRAANLHFAHFDRLAATAADHLDAQTSPAGAMPQDQPLTVGRGKPVGAPVLHREGELQQVPALVREVVFVPRPLVPLLTSSGGQ